MKELTIICVAYRRYRNIPVLIHCLLAQTLQNFKLVVIHDGFDPEMERILLPFKSGNPDVVDYRFTDKRYNDFGHSLRDIGIALADTEYILITNDDNYYCPKFLEYMFGFSPDADRPDIIMCDMVHSHANPGGRPQGPYGYFQTFPRRYSVDIGCFIAKTSLAKQVGFRDKSHDGDATYFEDLVGAKSDIRIAKVGAVLFMHN